MRVALAAGGHVSARHYASHETGAPWFVFAHGAGAGQTHPFMVAYAEALAARGVDVVTFNFPYLEAGRRLPDRAPVLEACFRDVIAEVDGRFGVRGRLAIGGKSMGGRMATHLAAQGLEGLRGVVALGYPLHPPGKPSQLRVAHLPQVTVPLLVVQGERDAFGGPDELAPHLASVPGGSRLHVVPGGDHSLARRGVPPAQTRDEVAGVIAGWLRDLYPMRP